MCTQWTHAAQPAVRWMGSGQQLMWCRGYTEAPEGSCSAGLRLDGVECHVAVQQKVRRHSAADPHRQLSPAWLRSIIRWHTIDISRTLPPAVSIFGPNPAAAVFSDVHHVHHSCAVRWRDQRVGARSHGHAE